MNLATTLRLLSYGTTEGAVKGWDTRGRSGRGSSIASADLKRRGDMVSYVGVQPEYQRRGIASALYDHIERDLGVKLSPENWAHTPEGDVFWKGRVAQGNQ